MEKIQRFMLISTAIGMTLSFLYLFGFWGAFDVNILNYITLADVLKYGLFPISIFALIVIIIFVPLIITESGSPHKEDESSLEVDHKKIRIWSCLLLGFISCLAILYAYDQVEFLTISMLFSFGLTIIFMDLPLFVKKIPYALYRFCIIGICLVIVFNTAPIGYRVADKVKNNNRQLKIDGEISKYTYIDVTDKYLFLWNKETNSVKVMKLENISSFEYSID